MKFNSIYFLVVPYKQQKLTKKVAKLSFCQHLPNTEKDALAKL